MKLLISKKLREGLKVGDKITIGKFTLKVTKIEEKK
jgi:predicted lysophospholipase L1 biosynthesis ABC-type transport system permease subunit